MAQFPAPDARHPPRPARVRFPRVGEMSYLLTLGGYGFYWMRLPTVGTDDSTGVPR